MMSTKGVIIESILKLVQFKQDGGYKLFVRDSCETMRAVFCKCNNLMLSDRFFADVMDAFWSCFWRVEDSDGEEGGGMKKILST